MSDLCDLPPGAKICPEMTKTFRWVIDRQYGSDTGYTIKYAPCMGEKCGKWSVCAGAKLEAPRDTNSIQSEAFRAAKALLAGAVRLRKNIQGPVEWLDEYRVDARYIERLRRAVEFDV